MPSNTSVLVRVQYLTRKAQARGGSELELACSDDAFDVCVHITSTRHADVEGKVLLITASSEVSPPPQVLAAMRKLAAGAGLPDSIAEYGTATSLEVATRMRRAFELVRWRSNASVPNHPFEYVGADFSVDGGKTWVRLPLKARTTVRRPAGLAFDEEASASLMALAADGVDEPVAHHLLREAFDVAGANPRSAIVIGVAALEAGFKHLVEKLLPESAWLVEKLPSPPVTKMLAEFMPTLPAVLTFDDTVHPPPKYARKLVAEAVEERNRVAHTGAAGMDAKALASTLECFRDLLYLFDYHSGHAWALDHLSTGFRTALSSQT